MMAVAVDPAFATNHFIYVYYTFKKNGVCEYGSNGSTRLRSTASRASCSRDDDTVDPASETVLIDNIPAPEGYHIGADLHFGKDGYLYVSTGDGGCDYADPVWCDELQRRLARPARAARQGPARSRATARSRPATRTRAPDSARCNVTGRTDPGQEVPGDLRLGPAQSVPDRVRPERRRHALLHQRRGRDHLGGDRPRPGRRRLRLERARGALRDGLDHRLRPAAGRHDEPDLRLQPRLSRAARRSPAARSCRTASGQPHYDGAYLYADLVCGKIFRLIAGRRRRLHGDRVRDRLRRLQPRHA